MAYLRKDDETQQNKPPAEQVGQNGGLLSGYMAPHQSLRSQSPPGSVAATYGGGGSGPTVTGHINFDSIYAANEGTARRDANKYANSAVENADTAQRGLRGLQSEFSSQSKAAQGSAPTQAQRDWAAKPPTPAAPIVPTNTVNATSAGQQGRIDWSNYLNPTSDPSRPETQSINANTPKPPDYESQVRAGASGKYDGPGSLMDLDGYKGLLDQYKTAERGLSGIQDDAHLQGMLAEQNKGPFIEGGNKLDAALTGAAGRERFAELGKVYKGLGNELNAANKQAGAQAAQSRAAAQQNAAAHQGLLGEYLGRTTPQSVPGDNGAAGASEPWRPGTYGDIDSFLHGGDFGQNTHQAGLALSPADWLTRGLGEAGVYQGPNATEIFGSQFGGSQEAWGISNARTALQQVQNEYGGEAAAYLWDHMTPEMWQAYTSQNSGASALDMRKWLESAGFKKQENHQNDDGEVTGHGYDSGDSYTDASGQTQETTAEEEDARREAYRNGWGESYDEQFLNGNRTPVQP